MLAALDEIEGFGMSEPDSAPLTPARPVLVTLENGARAPAWVYFYNAPLGRAARIASGDYLEHTRVR